MHEKSWAKRPVLESNKHCHFRRSICLSRQEQATHFIIQIPPNLISSSDMERPSTGSRTGATTLQLRTLYAVPGSGAIFLSGVTNFMQTTLKEVELFALSSKQAHLMCPRAISCPMARLRSGLSETARAIHVELLTHIRNSGPIEEPYRVRLGQNLWQITTCLARFDKSIY